MIKGDLPAWRARRVARATIVLSMEAAAYVDRHVAHVAHKVRPAQLDRLVEEAIGRFMPEEAERRRRQAADGRSFTVDTRQPSLAGHQRRVRGARPGRRPRPRRRRRRRRAGVEGPRLHRHPGRAPGHRRRGPRPPPAHPRPQPHPRRPATDGDVATGDDRATAEPTETSQPPRKTRKPRQVVMYVHLSDAAVVPGAPLAGRVRAGREHPGSGARRTDPAVVRQPRRPDHRQPRASTSTSTSTSRPTRSAAGCGNRPS